MAGNSCSLDTFSDPKQRLCEGTQQLKWDEAGGPGAACMKAFTVAQVLIMITKGKRNWLYPPARALGLAAKCLKQVFPGVCEGVGPVDAPFLKDALVPIFLLLSPHASRQHGK